MKLNGDIGYIGVNDTVTDLFEGHYHIPDGISYNSYLITDERYAVMDTVDRKFTDKWLSNLESALEGRQPDYLIVQHMEPDHSANILIFMKKYKNAVIVSSSKAFAMMKNFFGTEFEDRRLIVGEGDSLNLGRHTLNFITAPMVHWPEVIMTYDSCEKILFSADAFGKFGIPEKDDGWTDEAARYYFGIVGKYGAQVQSVLKKAQNLDIQSVYPLHGPVLTEHIEHYISLYLTWSSYIAENDGIVICYTSVYGHTEDAVKKLAEMLKKNGCRKLIVNDLARTDMAKAVADAFRYDKLVLATTTYNAEIFPYMREYINCLTERGFKNRTVALIENGSWAPAAAKTMHAMLENCKNITFAENTIHIKSALDDGSSLQLELLSEELCRDYIARDEKTADKKDMSALFKIGYGLYAVTVNDGKKDNALIVNTVSQVTNTPNRIAVTVSKQNYSHDIIRKTGKMNINCLSVDAPFSVFESFGFRSGRDSDKFAGTEVQRSDNGLVILPRFINAFMSLEVENYIDLDTHGMFICSVSEARVISDLETMTYTYYQNNVKPKPETEKKGYVCKVCGYIYEGDTLPEDFVCPLCKHGASDFEKIQ